MVNGMLFAQEIEKAQEGHHHAVSFNKPNAFAANVIIWVSVAVVIVTLALTLKYMIWPHEDNPNHIKNIVKDEGF